MWERQRWSQLGGQFNFIFEKPGGKLVFKLHQNTDTTAICHFEIFDRAHLSELFRDRSRNLVPEPINLNLLTYLHHNSKNSKDL